MLQLLKQPDDQKFSARSGDHSSWWRSHFFCM